VNVLVSKVARHYQSELPVTRGVSKGSYNLSLIAGAVAVQQFRYRKDRFTTTAYAVTVLLIENICSALTGCASLGWQLCYTFHELWRGLLILVIAARAAPPFYTAANVKVILLRIANLQMIFSARVLQRLRRCPSGDALATVRYRRPYHEPS
jgi:hypothetical protein